MKTKKYNIVNAKKYEINGEKKTFWANIGRMTEFHKDDGGVGRILELNDRNSTYQIFPIEDNQGAPKPKKVEQSVDYPELNDEDIPF